MQNNIIISNQKNLERTIELISRDGAKNLHILSDFDKTLTKAFIEWQEVHSIIAQIREGNYLTPDYSSRAHALFDKYHPIEIDSKTPLKEKKKAMHEWWDTHFKLLAECGLDKKVMGEIVRKRKLRFREGALEFIDLLHQHNIPLVIMSAAPGDMLRMYLEQEKRLYNNIYIVANLFEFGKNGKVIRVKEPIIHSMNKDETALQNFPVFEVIKERRNVILLGDSLGDVGMIEGFDYSSLLKIGFLNENAKSNLGSYRRTYDVVILNDSDMNYVNELMMKIIGQ